jgi:hypothetical protein
MAFHPGMKVECISDNWFNEHAPWRKPEVSKGQIYIVRDLTDCFGYPGLYFEGLRACYHQDAFRPIVEKKTDISIFTAMLTPKKVKEREPV